MTKTKLLLLALCAIALTGCEKPTPEEKQRLEDIKNKRRAECLHTVDYNGHSYIIYQASYKGGITHDPDCQCHNKQSNIE